MITNQEIPPIAKKDNRDKIWSNAIFGFNIALIVLLMFYPEIIVNVDNLPMPIPILMLIIFLYAIFALPLTLGKKIIEFFGRKYSKFFILTPIIYAGLASLVLFSVASQSEEMEGLGAVLLGFIEVPTYFILGIISVISQIRRNKKPKNGIDEG